MGYLKYLDNRDNYIIINIGHGGGYTNCKYISFETNKYKIYKSTYEQYNIPNIKYSVAINPFFRPNDYYFEPGGKHPNTYLYMARCSDIKGLGMFLNIAAAFPQKKFWIAGGCLGWNKEKNLLKAEYVQEDINLNDFPNVKYWGPVTGNLKLTLLSRATALIQPSQYFEPCGWNAIESLLSGTPVIFRSDSGGYQETLIDSVSVHSPHLLGKYDPTYYKTQNSWISEIDEIFNRIDMISPQECRRSAIDKFSEEKAWVKYYNFFKNVLEHEM